MKTSKYVEELQAKSAAALAEDKIEFLGAGDISAAPKNWGKVPDRQETTMFKLTGNWLTGLLISNRFFYP